MRDSQPSDSTAPDLGRAAKSTAFALVMTAIGLGANYLFNIAVAHWFGPADFGLFAAGYALLNALAIVVVLGLDAIVLREAAGARARGDMVGARAILRRAALLVLLAGCAVGVGLALAARPITASFFAATPGIAPVLQAFAPALPAIAVGTVLLAGLQAIQDVRVRMLLRYGLDPLLRFGFGALAYGLGASILGAVAAVTAASATMALGALAAFHRMAARQATAVAASVATIGWLGLLGASWPLTGAALFNLAAMRSDTLILLSLTGAHEVGLYSAALMTAAMITVLLMVVETIMSPLFADRIARTGIGSVEPLFRLSLRWVTLLAVPAFLFFAVAAPEIMGLFGTEFRAAAPAFVLLSAGALVNCLTGSANYVLILSGKTKLVLANSIAYAAVVVVANYVAIQEWGILGAATAMLATTIVLNLARLIEVAVLFRIHPFSRASAWPVGIGAAIWVGAALLQDRLSAVATWPIAVAAVLFYAAILLAVGLDPADRQLLGRALATVRR